MQSLVQRVVGAVVLAFPWAARPSAIGTHQIEAALVSMSLRQGAHADVFDLRSGFGVQRIGVDPAFGAGVKVLDAISNASYPVPAERFDITKPGATEAGIGDDDGARARAGPAASG